MEPSSPPHPPPPVPPLVAGPTPTQGAAGSDGRSFAHPRTDVVSQEAVLLRQALTALRRDHDARAALRVLDDYDRRFGQGSLAWEAASTRAQALLQIGDNARALELLDRLPLSHDRPSGELRVSRGELRSVAGRCREALLDFDAVLSASSGSDPNEVARALFGRASCRARLGDSAGAEADRQRYLSEYPHGPAAGRLLSGP